VNTDFLSLIRVARSRGLGLYVLSWLNNYYRRRCYRGLYSIAGPWLLSAGNYGKERNAIRFRLLPVVLML